ncbi:RNA-guided endonuclease InsQ/TnpB family protein [Streptomyces sp. NBC_00470]|uniref:RNA-guided endonuclease InsQ/TnpB family protein n=1 Tax=Streptomyces sp. NBC_00470 TaxID=2975753 RepID=UPI00324C9858
MSDPQRVHTAYKICLDPTAAQDEIIRRHVGARRWAYNWALDKLVACQKSWSALRDDLVENKGLTPAQATAQIKKDYIKPAKDAIKLVEDQRKETLTATRVATGDEKDRLRAELATVRRRLVEMKAEACQAGYVKPSHFDLIAWWRAIRDLPRDEGGCPWYEEVNPYAFTAGMADALEAMDRWMKSASGKMAGRRVGYPRFKAKGKSTDAYRLHHDVKNPSIVAVSSRRLEVPRLGTVHTHQPLRRLRACLEQNAGRIQSVTISRAADKWYASVLVDHDFVPAAKPTARQRVGGVVGVDLGSTYLAVASDRLERDNPASTRVPSPKTLGQDLDKLRKAQRSLSRTAKGSNNRRKAIQRVARLHLRVAQARDTHIHRLTRSLVDGFTHVVIEDLDLAGMLAQSAEDRGFKSRKLQAQFNRHLLDTSPGRVREQLNYKAARAGSSLVILDKDAKPGRTCGKCGAQNSQATPLQGKFHCTSCGHVADRHDNAAKAIAKAGRRKIAADASDAGESKNA